MDSLFEIILIVGLLGFGVIGQIRKAARTSAEADKRTPVFIPENEEDVFQQITLNEPPQPQPSAITVQQFKSRQKKTSRNKATRPGEVKEMPLQETEDTSQAFNIHSLDDVRKGIIWSEILNRKY